MIRNADLAMLTFTWRDGRAILKDLAARSTISLECKKPFALRTNGFWRQFSWEGCLAFLCCYVERFCRNWRNVTPSIAVFAAFSASRTAGPLLTTATTLAATITAFGIVVGTERHSVDGLGNAGQLFVGRTFLVKDGLENLSHLGIAQ